MNNNLKEFGYRLVTFFVNDDLKQKIDSYADSKGITRSTAIWLIVDDYMSKIGG